MCVPNAVLLAHNVLFSHSIRFLIRRESDATCHMLIICATEDTEDIGSSDRLITHSALYVPLTLDSTRLDWLLLYSMYSMWAAHIYVFIYASMCACVKQRTYCADERRFVALSLSSDAFAHRRRRDEGLSLALGSDVI